MNHHRPNTYGRMEGDMDYVEVLNTHTGRRGRVPRHIFDNPAFNKYLVDFNEVKPPVAELFKSRTPEEYEASRKRRRRTQVSEQETPDESVVSDDKAPENTED